MSDVFFSVDLLGKFDRLQRQIASVFACFPASLRATRSETFRPLHIGSTDDSVEIDELQPGGTARQSRETAGKGGGDKQGPPSVPGGQATDIWWRDMDAGWLRDRNDRLIFPAVMRGQRSVQSRATQGVQVEE